MREDALIQQFAFTFSAEICLLIATSRFRYLAILIAFGASGCASTITVEYPNIPQPHVEKLPLIVALRIPDEFYDFTHEENVLGRESWTIRLGDANAMFFKQLFGYMFDEVILLEPDDDALNYKFDALVEPRIEGFEFSVPNQSKTDAFAVWIRYRMQIFDSAGTRASSWTVSAYGKSQKEGMGSAKSLRRAAVLAMRDAAALILLQMDKATKIGDLANGPLQVSEPHKPILAGNENPDEDDNIGIFAIGGIEDDDK